MDVVCYLSDVSLASSGPAFVGDELGMTSQNDLCMNKVGCSKGASWRIGTLGTDWSFSVPFVLQMIADQHVKRVMTIVPFIDCSCGRL